MDLIARNGRELRKKPVNGVAGFEMVKKGLNSNACAGKTRFAVHDLRVSGDHRIHVQIIAYGYTFSVKSLLKSPKNPGYVLFTHSTSLIVTPAVFVPASAKLIAMR